MLKISDTPLRSIAWKKLQSPASFTTVFLERTENGWSCMRCASLLTSLPLHPRADSDQVI
jgi:hypothetical protein